MGEPAGTISALVASWFTPSSLFILVNLVIGTIAITSRFGAPKRQVQEPELGPHGSPQLVRSSSWLDRVKSFNVGLYNHEPTLAETQCVHPQLVRTPSLLERLKSFNFGLYHYEPTPAETQCVHPQLVRTPSLLERVKSLNFGLYQYEPTPAETGHEQPDQTEQHENPYSNPDNPPQPQLARTPSLLERLKSMDFSHLYRSESINAEKEPEINAPGSNPGHESGKGVGNLGERRRESEKAEKMRKSASEKSGSAKCEEDEGMVERRRPATARSETASFRGDEEVDAKADDFINRFKKQLRLQRVDSILRYREMLKGN